MPTVIDTPDASEIEKEKNLIILKTDGLKERQFVITSDQQFQDVCLIGTQLATLEKKIEALYEKSKSLSDQTHKSICALEKSHIEPVRMAKKFARELASAWLLSEKQRLQAEQDRILKEAQEKADAESAAAVVKQEDQRLEMAQDLVARGDVELADQVMSAPIHVAPPIAKVSFMPSAKPKAAGTSNRKKYSHEVTDASLVPREYLSVDDAKIRKYIAYKQDEAVIPGVKIWLDISVSFKSN